MLKSIESLDGLEEKLNQQIDLNNIENKENNIIDGMHSINLPQTNNDSRALLENQIIEKLTIDQQNELYNSLISLVQEAIFDSEKDGIDQDYQRYYKGIKCALNQILIDLNKSLDLYFLLSKYKKIILNLREIYEDFDDSPENNFFSSKLKGIISGFINFSEALKNKLSKKENTIFRQENLQPLR